MKVNKNYHIVMHISIIFPVFREGRSSSPLPCLYNEFISIIQSIRELVQSFNQLS